MQVLPSTADAPPECCICLEEICNDCVVKLDCNHVFHTTCLNQWVGFSRNGSSSLIACPLCRASYRVEAAATAASDQLQFLPAGPGEHAAHSSSNTSTRDGYHAGADESEVDALASTVGVLTLIKFCRRRRIIMVITGIDILVGLLRMLVSQRSESVMIDSALQVAASSYGFFGAVYLRSMYLMVYFVICLNSTALRFVSPCAYLNNHFPFDVTASAALNATAVNALNATADGQGYPRGEPVLLILLVLALSFGVQAWIAWITFRLRADILKFRRALERRFLVRLQPPTQLQQQQP